MMLKRILAALLWFVRLFLGGPTSSVAVYCGHSGFEAPEAQVLDALLPAWNKKAGRFVDEAAATRAKFGIHIGRAQMVQKGLGIFNGNAARIPRNKVFGVYCGGLVKDDNDDNATTTSSSYNQNMRAWMTSPSLTGGGGTPKVVECYVDGNPALLREKKGIKDEFGSRINHACRPNCVSVTTKLRVDKDMMSLSMFVVQYKTHREIHEGEELTIDYGRDYVVNKAEKGRRYTPCRCSATAWAASC